MNAPKQRLVVLGATGSIGVNTLDVVARHPERFEVLALSAQHKVDLLAEQCRRFSPRFAVAGSNEAAARLVGLLQESGTGTTVLAGVEALEKIACLPEADTIMAAIVGAAGLRPTLAAARAGKKVLLANKEALVMAGSVFMQEVARNGAILLPIDSEHNAIYQSLPKEFSSDLSSNGVRRLILTASGGPFRELPLESLHQVTPAQACAHPNWVMGRKISVDSATMMNKGLEVIEAHWLFNAPSERIEVVIHPQSVIHSMVEYADGSVIAQLGNPDMRTPIAYALAYPERIEAGVESLDLCRVGKLDFERADFVRFPCLRLAYEALDRGGNAPAVLNAANEVAVEAFLAGTLAFTRIPMIIEQTLADVAWCDMVTLEDVLAADASGREAAKNLINTSRRQ
ncbi:MAG: 1-deoxy-D-xylulose-5-phosphate reductoisomerase [Betaproteobacteria bacterium HGW-Betaproteobacteria-14]|nr:MAG: 1-deoxy-D-xylulose-5-phosphate reductoisomerase [Betaproteobacteria bacterium HGW-Betaproteobacteria-14]